MSWPQPLCHHNFIRSFFFGLFHQTLLWFKEVECENNGAERHMRHLTQAVLSTVLQLLLLHWIDSTTCSQLRPIWNLREHLHLKKMPSFWHCTIHRGWSWGRSCCHSWCQSPLVKCLKCLESIILMCGANVENVSQISKWRRLLFSWQVRCRCEVVYDLQLTV